MSVAVVREFAFDLGKYIDCDGCRHKISKIVKRLEGVYNHRFEEKRMIVKAVNMDPSNVIRSLSKVTKDIRFVGTYPNQHQPPPPQGADFNHFPPQRPPAEHFSPFVAQQYPPPMQHHYPVHACCTNEPPPSSACHCPPPPPQGPVHACINEPLPPSSACHCPPPNYGHGPPLMHPSACHCPPTGCNQALPHGNNGFSCHHGPNDALAKLENFIQGSSSPNASHADFLGQLANVKNLKQVDLIEKKGIKLTFQDGHVTSYYPINSMELRPGYNYNALPPHQLPPRYVSPFSDENPNGFCSIM